MIRGGDGVEELSVPLDAHRLVRMGGQGRKLYAAARSTQLKSTDDVYWQAGAKRKRHRCRKHTAIQLLHGSAIVKQASAGRAGEVCARVSRVCAGVHCPKSQGQKPKSEPKAKAAVQKSRDPRRGHPAPLTCPDTQVSAPTGKLAALLGPRAPPSEPRTRLVRLWDEHPASRPPQARGPGAPGLIARSPPCARVGRRGGQRGAADARGPHIARDGGGVHRRGRRRRVARGGAAGGAALLTLEGHTKAVSSVACINVGGGAWRVVSGSFDCTVRVWDGATGVPLDCYPLGVSRYPLGVSRLARPFFSFLGGRNLRARGQGW